MSDLLRLIIPNPDKPEAATMLVPSKEDSAHIAVDNVDTKNGQEDSGGNEERYFVITNIQEGQHVAMDVISEGVGDTEEEVMNGERTVNEDTVMQEQVGISESEERPAWMDLCRVCANVNDHLIPIFEGEGLQHELCDKIHKYLPIRVCEEDTLPLHLCYHCAATLLAWHELLEGCLNAERKLLEMQESAHEKEQGLEAVAQEAELEPNIVEQPLEELESVKEDACKESTVNDPDRWQIESNDIVQVPTTEIDSTNAEELPYIECSHCDIVFLDAKCLIKHMNVDHDTQVNYCQYCKLICHGDRYAFEEHLSAHKDTTEAPRTSTYQNEKDDRNWQDGCAASESVKEDKSAAYACNLCEKNFSKKLELRKHISKHTEVKRIQNPDETELLRKAKQVINDRVSYKCDVCKKEIFTNRGFLRHIRVHSGKRPCKCEFCGKSYRIEQDLARHIRDVHEGVKKYACDICSRTFANKGTRDDHRRIHTGERPYVCEHCPKTFRTLNSIYIHNRVHTNYKPHKCSYCGKHFRSRQRLTNHETTHTGIKAFSCEICGKSFSVKGEVMRHRAIHNQEKPFDCKCCGMKFGQRRYLRNHIKQHHKEEAPLMLSELMESRR